MEGKFRCTNSLTSSFFRGTHIPPKKLPGNRTQRTILWLKEFIHKKVISGGKITLKPGKMPPKTPKIVKKHQNPIELLKLYESMLKESNLPQNQLSKRIGISRVRITQIMNLHRLDPWIIDYIEQHPNNRFYERQLRPLTSIKSATIQISKFRSMW